MYGLRGKNHNRTQQEDSLLPVMERAFQRSQMHQKLDLWLLGLWKHKFLLLGYLVCGTCCDSLGWLTVDTT